jgi:hypothetical protein
MSGFRLRKPPRMKPFIARSVAMSSVAILAIENVTHNVRRYTLEKPEG